MSRRILLLVTALVMALMMSLGGAAFAVNSGPTCSFEKGTTTCTTIHGSHGSTDTHNGQVGSNGKDTGGSTGKVTGSGHTIQ